MGFKADEIFADFTLRFGQTPANARTLSEALRRVQNQAGVAADAMDRMGKRQGRARQEMKKTTAAAKKQSAAMSRLGAAAKRSLAVLLGFEAVRRIIVGSLRIFTAFRSEMNSVRAILNATDEDFARLSATARQLGATTQFTARDAAGALKFLARTGLDTEEALGALPKVLDLAAASGIDLATSADIATNIMKGMRLEVSDLGNLVDVLAKTTNSANVDMFELGEAMKIVAPVAAAAGQSVEETAALIGALGDAGIKGTLAGTSLRRMIINLQTGAGQAGPAIARLGLEVNDAEGNFVGLTEIMRQLEGQTVTATDLFELFGTRGIAAAQVLGAKGSAALDELTASLENAGGTAERMREQQMAGLPGVALRLKSAFEGVAITTVQILEPALVSAGNFVVDKLIPAFIGFRTGILLVGDAITLGLLLAIDGAKIAFAGLRVAIFGLLEGIGFMLRELGELGEIFDLEVGTKVANAGQQLLLFGADARRTAQRDLAGTLQGATDNLSTGMTVMRDRIGEAVNEILGVVPAANAAAGALEDLETQTASLGGALAVVAVAPLDLSGFNIQLDELQARIREVFGLEGVGRLSAQELLEVQSTLREMTDEQRDQALALLDSEEALRDVLVEIVELETERADNAQDLAKVAEINEKIREAVSGIADASIEADKAMENFGKSADDAGSDLAGNVRVVLRGVNRLGDAFGFLNDDIRRAVDSVLDIVTALEKARTASGAISLAGGIGIAGAAAGLLGGLLGGESAASKAARESAEENTEALKNLSRNLGALQDIILNTAGELLAVAADAIDSVFEKGLVLFDKFRLGFVLTQDELDALTAFGETLGITLDVVKEVDGGFVVLKEDMEALREAMAKIDMAALTDTFAGASEIAADRRALDDAEDDSLRTLEELLALFAKFTDLPPGIDGFLKSFDLSTAAGRSALDKFIRQLFEQLASAEGLDPAVLGKLSAAEFKDALLDMEKLLDDLGDEAESQGGDVTNFVRDSRITVAQGSVVIAQLDSIRVLNRLQLDQLMILTGQAGPGVLLPPPSSATAAVTGGVGTATTGGGSVTIQGVTINVNLQGGTEDNQVREFGNKVGIAAAEALDQALQELLRRRQRGVGDPSNTSRSAF